ncbi:hypothetical protein H5410_006599 [Solanum commersonii]|uniref:Uncharacterized protein n=1 Tax=Solanum commersonii TaxID=4109 RepID=A0A9J6A9T1_SOLCO|nr:hypothetical protein H5410_006599 [Solanum commersonii]
MIVNLKDLFNREAPFFRQYGNAIIYEQQHLYCITILQMLLLQNDQLSIFRRTAISHTANTVGRSLSTMHSKLECLTPPQDVAFNMSGPCIEHRIFMQFKCCMIEINGNLKQKTIIVKNIEILENKNALSKGSSFRF